MAAEGARVVAADIHEATNGCQSGRIEAAGGQAIGIRCDVSDTAQVESLIARTVEQYGASIFWFNNAALVHHPESNVHFLELDTDSWQRALEINLSGTFFCSQQVARIMVAQVAAGSGTGGSIVNMSSGGGSRAHRQLFNYDTTKGGIEAATRAMALDLAPGRLESILSCLATLL